MPISIGPSDEEIREHLKLERARRIRRIRWRRSTGYVVLMTAGVILAHAIVVLLILL